MKHSFCVFGDSKAWKVKQYTRLKIKIPHIRELYKLDIKEHKDNYNDKTK
jgi:hypothetical protein